MPRHPSRSPSDVLQAGTVEPPVAGALVKLEAQPSAGTERDSGAVWPAAGRLAIDALGNYRAKSRVTLRGDGQ